MVNSRSPSLRRHRRRGSRRRSASRIVYEPELLEDDEYYYSVYPYYEYPWIWPDEDYSIWYYNDDDNDVYEDRRRRPKYHLDDIIDDEREDDDGDPALNPWYPQDGPSLPIYTHDEDERPPRRRKSLTRKERRIPTPHHHLGAQTTSAAADDWPSDQPLCVEEAAAIPRLERRRTIHVPPLSTVQDQPPLRRRHSVFEQPTGATVSPMIPMSQAQPMTPLSPWSHQQMLLPPPPQQQFSRMPTIPPSVLSQRPQPPSMPMMQPQLPPPAPMMPMLRPQLPMQFQPNIIGPLPPLPPVPPTLPFLQAHHHPLDAPFPPPPVGMPPPPLAPPLPPLAPAAVPPPTTVPISASAQAPAQASHPAPEPKETAEAAAAGAGAIVGAATTAATASREMKDSQDSGKKEQKEAEEAEGQQEKKEQQETAENDKINAAKEQEQEQPAENASSIKETSSAPDVQERGSSPPKADAPLRRSRSLFGGLFGGSGGRGGGSSSKPKPVILNKSMWQPTAVVPMEEILQSNHKPRTVARQRNLLFPAGHPLNNRLQQLPESKDASSSAPGTTRLSRKESMRLAQKAKRLSGRSHIWCYRPLEETGEQIVWAAFDAPNQARLDPFLPAVVHKQPIRATPYTSVFLEREPELPGSTVVAPLAGRGYHFKNTFTSHKPILLEVACLPSSDKLMVRSAESFDPAPPLSFATSNNNSIADKLWNAFF